MQSGEGCKKKKSRENLDLIHGLEPLENKPRDKPISNNVSFFCFLLVSLRSNSNLEKSEVNSGNHNSE